MINIIIGEIREISACATVVAAHYSEHSEKDVEREQCESNTDEVTCARASPRGVSKERSAGGNDPSHRCQSPSFARNN